MRLFIAITLSEKANTSLCSAMDGLRRGGVRGRFTAPEKLHLTLAFLGEREGSAEAERVLAGLSFRPFLLSLSGSGSFGDVLWAGVERSPQLEALEPRERRALDARLRDPVLVQMTHTAQAEALPARIGK